MGPHGRRRSAHRHRRPFLKVTEAEVSADSDAFTGRLRRAIHEAEVLGLADVVAHLDAALALAVRHLGTAEGAAGAAETPKSVGQHGAEPAG